MNRKHLEEVDCQKKQSNVVKIAITCFGEEIAPCFAATRRFRIWELGPDDKINCGELAIDEIGRLARIRLLKQSGIDVLICNGIEGQARQLLETGGCHVVESIVGSVTDALYGYLAGKIPGNRNSGIVAPVQLQPHTADLVEWTQELFISLGWSAERFTESEAYPIDLIATIECPVCGKPVRIAISCGAHTYRVESEIQEFGHVTARVFHSRVYVHHAMPNIIDWCHDYEIELLDPVTFSASAVGRLNSKQLPPLKCRIKGHDKINIEQQEKKQ